MRKISVVVLAFVLLLTGCAPNFQKDQQIVQEKDDSKKKAIIPKYKISDQYYQTILPFEPSEARGVIVGQLNTRYDIDEFETGLMRIARNTFSPDKYLFQEGQYLDGKKVKLWLNREYTDEQVKAKKMKPEENIGLNPVDPGVGDAKTRNEENPIYLAHILEHNYLVKGEDGTARLGGVVIGLALNSVHYYQEIKYGPTYEKKISHEKLDKEGKKIAEEVVGRLRHIKGLEKVPITIALFEQESRSSVVPGNFFAYANVGEGSSKIGGWENVREDYVLFPSDDATKNHRDDLTAFSNFKQDVEEYFPNFNGVTGRAFYIDNELQELNININMQFYGKAEAVGFTQYVAGLVLEHFPDYISVEVNITSVNGQEALIVRDVDQKEPFVHIYH
ncbi:CamS family sex pheromone protein [Robertmurraya andreesenii]|uniref:Protein involved in sex pheromone biosynthesis n=1 Tax=Anoxybacillus andreesenii TaxID=1325932 RepID=A0ABT9V7E9_9BACL|nr:CamS family sex pheromone protein [Robertmurraya andreesenii]MDQ0156880.1 protein involved in sex pheromone biosynthesis [Robertmurraya andreesenii]